MTTLTRGDSAAANILDPVAVWLRRLGQALRKVDLYEAHTPRAEGYAVLFSRNAAVAFRAACCPRRNSGEFPREGPVRSSCNPAPTPAAPVSGRCGVAVGPEGP